MSSTFRELLSQKTDAVEAPRALAPGHYIGAILSHEMGQSKQKQTPYVRFNFTVSEESEDVEPGLNDGVDFTKKQLNKVFYLTPTSLFRLKNFLKAVMGNVEGRTFDELIPETRGIPVLLEVTTRDNEDGSETYNDVGKVVAYFSED